jgi:endo-1,4-beta-xylanase
MKPHFVLFAALYAAFAAGPVFAQQTALRDAAAPRALLMGAAADSNEFGEPDRLQEPDYAATLGTQYSMLEPENAMKWATIHPEQNTYDFGPGDNLVAFAQAHGMKVRGHNLLWYSFNPAWLTTLAQTATPAQMAQVLEDHINTVVGHYKGKVFAWDVVNEAISDSATGTGTGSDIRDSIWYNQPGIGTTGDGFIEQAFRWAHAADPNALLFYNDYNIEQPGAKFNAVYNMVKDLLSRGTPINGVGIQMHIPMSGYPSSDGLAQVIQQFGALGLQVHITEMDVRLAVDSNGQASAADLQTQAQTYQRILTVCLQNPACTAFQTWGFTDKYSWIPGSYPGQGAALPFDANYQPKPAVAAMLDALENTPPSINTAGIVNAASYKGGAVSPGEIVTLFQVNYGPSALTVAQPQNGQFPDNIGGAQVFFGSTPAPLIYAEAGVVSAVAPFEIAGSQQVSVYYKYNSLQSATVTLPVAPSAPAIFAANSTGSGAGAILNQDNSLNSADNPVPADGQHVIQVFGTGGGMLATTPSDGSLAAPGLNDTTQDVTATIGGKDATVTYHGAAPGLISGLLQVNVQVPAGLAPGPQPLVITVGGVPSQDGITVAVE